MSKRQQYHAQSICEDYRSYLVKTEVALQMMQSAGPGFRNVVRLLKWIERGMWTFCSFSIHITLYQLPIFLLNALDKDHSHTGRHFLTNKESKSILRPPWDSQICVVHGRETINFLSRLRYRRPRHDWRRSRDGNRVLCHKNACLNENVVLPSFPVVEWLFFLLESWPFSSYRSIKGLISWWQKSCSSFGKGARILQ